MKKIKIRPFLFRTFLIGLWGVPAGVIRADLVFWKGGTGLWENASNWTNTSGGNVVPAAGDDVRIGPASAVLLSSETPLLASVQITGGTLIFTNWTTRLMANEVTIQSNAVVTVAGPFATNAMSNRVWIVCTNFYLHSGGRVDADGKGYPGSQGPGAASLTMRWGGGGYGGKGGWGDQGPGGVTNGSVHQPMSPGSGGANGSSGGAGGGVIWIQASGTADVKGVITARGNNGSTYSGGGSGGSIFLQCGVLTGTTNGLLTAAGGNGGPNAGGGGGGRIAVDYQVLGENCAVRFSTAPGSGWGDSNPQAYGWFRGSGWGSLSLPDGTYVTTAPPSNRFDRVALYFRDISAWAIESLNIEHNRMMFATPGLQMTVWGDWRVGTYAQAGIGEIMGDLAPRLTIGGRLMVTNAGTFMVFSGKATELLDGFGAEVRISNELHVAANSLLVPYSHWTDGGSVRFLTTNLTISAGGVVYAQGCGYAGTNGPGAGNGSAGNRGSGGGHGGWGGWTDTYVAGGATNGSLSRPIRPGSGGGALYAFGGGLIALQAVQANISGILNANGILGGSMGGGAGGAILLECETLSGTSPMFLANGGDGSTSNGGGGGGGRIALHVQNYHNLVNPRFQVRRGNGVFEGGVSNTWHFVARDGTLWLSSTNLLSSLMPAEQFRDLHLYAQGFTGWTVSTLVVSNNSFILAEDGFVLQVAGNLMILTNSLLGIGAVNGTAVPRLLCGGDLRVGNGGRLEVYSARTNVAYGAAGVTVEVAGVLMVETNGWIVPYSHQTNGGSPKFKVQSATFQPGGGFFAVGRGFQINAGPGRGAVGGSSRGGGGGHGGKGGDHSATVGSGGPTNGIVLAPYLPGSGGGNTGGNGGGVIWIEASGFIQVDGILNADGARHGGNQGGGAGGGILLVGRDIRVSTSGLLSAAGGDAGSSHGGGGGGGRIALWRNVPGAVQEVFLAGQSHPAAEGWISPTPFARFDGVARVPGGTGWQSGDPGTIRFVDGVVRGTFIVIR